MSNFKFYNPNQIGEHWDDPEKKKRIENMPNDDYY